MPRNGEEVRRRLQQAALELYRERGYHQTTTAEIAAKAGVTERTFFRHFPDKREVLFGGEALLTEALIRAVADAPHSLGPWETLFYAFRSVESLFIENRRFSEPRRRIIDSSPALQERELAKVRSLTATLASALRQRGVADRLAILAAQTGMVILNHAVASWLDDGSTELEHHLVQAFEDVRALSSSGSEAIR
jgi:AcrR family transcriptional regulator